MVRIERTTTPTAMPIEMCDGTAPIGGNRYAEKKDGLNRLFSLLDGATVLSSIF